MLGLRLRLRLGLIRSALVYSYLIISLGLSLITGLSLRLSHAQEEFNMPIYGRSGYETEGYGGSVGRGQQTLNNRGSDLAYREALSFGNNIPESNRALPPTQEQALGASQALSPSQWIEPPVQEISAHEIWKRNQPQAQPAQIGTPVQVQPAPYVSRRDAVQANDQLTIGQQRERDAYQAQLKAQGQSQVQPKTRYNWGQ